jgi:hypothetical protein
MAWLSVHCSSWWVRPCHPTATPCRLPGTALTPLHRSDTRRFGGGTTVSREGAEGCVNRGRLDSIAAAYSGNLGPKTGDSEIFHAFLIHVQNQFVPRRKRTYYITVRNTQIHSVGWMRSFSMVNQVVHIVTTALGPTPTCAVRVAVAGSTAKRKCPVNNIPPKKNEFALNLAEMVEQSTRYRKWSQLRMLKMMIKAWIFVGNWRSLFETLNSDRRSFEIAQSVTWLATGWSFGV